MPDSASDPKLFAAHGRSFLTNRYAYPVLSRRARGVSIGVNLSPDKSCNFRCVYCQVDRSAPAAAEPIDLARLAEEVDGLVEMAASGRIFQQTHFRATPAALRRLNDIAFSGDGEPTACGQFGAAVEVCAAIRRRRGLDGLKLVLITNASLLDRDTVRRALEVLDLNGGEVWAKLDAGTEAYYRKIARSAVPFERVLENIRQAARLRPIVIQTLAMRLDGQSPPAEEIEAYCRRLCEIAAAGGQIKLVQVHTNARPPAESRVSALPEAELEALAELVRGRTGLTVAAYGARG